MKKTGNMSVDGKMLSIGGVSVDDLANQYQTPLYIIDQKDFKDRAKTFINHFKSDNLLAHVIYASKAFINIYTAQLVSELGLHADAVSGGELYTLIQAGFDPTKIYFHGNNKLPHEIAYAIDHNVGTIIIDNPYEARQISQIAAEKGANIRALIRINPGIEADTHKYIQTTKEDSKFGMATSDPRTLDFVNQLKADENIDFVGIHCHIGSQVFKEKFFFEEAEAMVVYAKKLEDECGVEIEEINLGGGFGVYYTEDDQPFEYGPFLEKYMTEFEAQITKHQLQHVRTVSIEPGRSMINDSGSTLYRVGAVKQPSLGDPFVFIDGGMSDNMRPALYEAKYEATIANRMDEELADDYRVAGKLCETGDILIQNTPLQAAQAGDLLLIPRTGAYTYSMSSNYNRVERPAVVFVEDGESRLAVKRETYDDLIRNDMYYKD